MSIAEQEREIQRANEEHVKQLGMDYAVLDAFVSQLEWPNDVPGKLENPEEVKFELARALQMGSVLKNIRRRLRKVTLGLDVLLYNRTVSGTALEYKKKHAGDALIIIPGESVKDMLATQQPAQRAPAKRRH